MHGGQKKKKMSWGIKKEPKMMMVTNATTYFGCTAAPDDSCGVPFPAVPPSDALPASSALLHWGDFGTVGRHKSLGR